MEQLVLYFSSNKIITIHFFIRTIL